MKKAWARTTNKGRQNRKSQKLRGARSRTDRLRLAAKRSAAQQDAA